jgi:DNA-binding transcriptional MerR regulator
MDMLSEAELVEIERDFPEGLSVQQIVDIWTAHGERLTEATFRKYVQLGLLPRSVRVGKKGKHRGSQGLYPVTALRQLDHLRGLMRQGFTIEQIQREFLFVRGDLEALQRQLERVFTAIDAALVERGPDAMSARSVNDARALGTELLDKLEGVERRLSMRARMARATV